MSIKRFDILANCCVTVLSEMGEREARRPSIRHFDKFEGDFVVAAMTAYEEPGTEGQGHFLLGFADPLSALRAAASISRGLDLGPVKQLDDTAIDLLREFLSTIVGRVESEWVAAGIPGRFDTPVTLTKAEDLPPNVDQSESRLIEVKLGVNTIAFQASFVGAAAQASAGKRILVTDDSQIIRRLLCMTLDEAGYETQEASSGEEAIEKYQSFKPDVTFMDLVMPGMSGLDTVLEIRQIDPKARIIILTSSSRTDEVVTARTIGVTAYCLKPVKPPQLLEAVSKALNG